MVSFCCWYLAVTLFFVLGHCQNDLSVEGTTRKLHRCHICARLYWFYVSRVKASHLTPSVCWLQALFIFLFIKPNWPCSCMSTFSCQSQKSPYLCHKYREQSLLSFLNCVILHSVSCFYCFFFMSLLLEFVFASLPQLERGVAKVLGGDPKRTNFLYTNGKCVIIRNIDVIFPFLLLTVFKLVFWSFIFPQVSWVYIVRSCCCQLTDGRGKHLLMLSLQVPCDRQISLLVHFKSIPWFFMYHHLLTELV